MPQRFIDELFAEITSSGGEVIPIELTASEAEIERRLASDSRKHYRKLVDLELYRSLRAAGPFSTPTIPGTVLRIDTVALSAQAAAKAIAAQLSRR